MISTSHWFPLLFLVAAAFSISAVSKADLVVKTPAGETITSWDAGETAIIDPRYIDIRIENTGAVAAEDLSVGDAKSFRVAVGTEERKFFRLKVANP